MCKKKEKDTGLAKEVTSKLQPSETARKLAAMVARVSGLSGGQTRWREGSGGSWVESREARRCRLGFAFQAVTHRSYRRMVRFAL